MATMYVAWHSWNTKVIGQTTMQTEGVFIASQAVDISAGGATTEAPAGTDYADVWSDVPFYYAPVGGSTVAAKNSTCKPWPANTPVQIPNIFDFGTKVAGIAI